MKETRNTRRSRIMQWALTLWASAALAACMAVAPPEPTVQKALEGPIKPRDATRPVPQAPLPDLPPLASLTPAAAVEEKMPFEDKVFSLSARGAPLQDVVMGLAKEAELNLVMDKSVNPMEPVTIEVNNLSLRETLNLIFEAYDYFYVIDGNILRVKALETRFIKVEVPQFHSSAQSTGEGNTVGADAGGFVVTTSIDEESLDVWEQIREVLTPYGEYNKSYANVYGRQAADEYENSWQNTAENRTEVQDENTIKNESTDRRETGRGDDAAQARNEMVDTENQEATTTANRLDNRQSAEQDIARQGKNRNQDVNETVTLTSSQTRGLLSPKGRARFDPLSGNIVVTDIPERLDLIEEYLRRVEESARRQVIIEARIMEVRLDNRHQYGIDWSYVSQNIDLAMNLSPDIQRGVNLRLFNLEGNDALLKALSTQGDVNVLSSPRLHVLNNQSAVLNVGRSIPYLDFEVDCQTTQGGLATPICTTVPTIEREEVGVSLGVTPRISEDAVIALHIVPVIKDLVDFQDFLVQNNRFQVPIIDSRGSDTMVQAPDGSTVVIGGLIQETNTEEIEGVPLLKDVPLLGGLFSAQNRRQEKSELVISLTPHIVYQ